MNEEVEIVLIEDNKNDAELTIRALNKNNLANKLIHLKDGAEALDFLLCEGNFKDRKATTLPKVILLDLKMPKIDGLQVLRKIKSNEKTKSIPVVILTSSNEDPDIKECYELGVNSYVVKPVQFASFIKAVNEVGLYWMIVNQPPSNDF